ncbi:MAG: hypothetical protein JWN84_2352 [Nocardioides sp.]|jgi:hypothetical membrane protein|nr:hypothetical protein [Nocardioides sp.]
MDQRTTWGVALLLLRPAYVAVELAVAAATTGDYRLLDDTVSQLGESGCDAAYCSPGHDVMNAAIIGFGLVLAVGALLLAPHFGRVATALLVVAGLSSAAVGLAPVDQDAALHTLAATPLFVAQPLALLALARVLRARRGVSVALVVTGLATVVGAVGFVLAGDGAGAGGLERLALWPVLLGVAAAAVAVGPARSGGTHVAADCQPVPPPP